MRITADSNLLLRDALHDDAAQWPSAARALQGSDLVAVPIVALCEFVWVLRQRYKRTSADIADSIRLLLSSSNISTDRPAVEAGLRVLEAGGDFADGVIAYEGERLGGNEFVSFDKRAVAVLVAQGRKARALP